MEAAVYTVTFEGDEEPVWSGSFEEWRSGNRDLEPADQDAVQALAAGQSIEFGGGAAPIATVARVA